MCSAPSEVSEITLFAFWPLNIIIRNSWAGGTLHRNFLLGRGSSGSTGSRSSPHTRAQIPSKFDYHECKYIYFQLRGSWLLLWGGQRLHHTLLNIFCVIPGTAHLSAISSAYTTWHLRAGKTMQHVPVMESNQKCQKSSHHFQGRRQGKVLWQRLPGEPAVKVSITPETGTLVKCSSNSNMTLLNSDSSNKTQIRSTLSICAAALCSHP